MYHFHFSKVVLFTALSVIGANGSPSQRRQRSKTCNAEAIAEELQSKFWDSSFGSYMGGSLWTDANTLEDLYNLMRLTDTNTYWTVADDSYFGQAALNPSTDWNLFFDGSYDDAQWGILALLSIDDYKLSRGQDGSHYMTSALAIYDIVAAQWDDSCGGGVWWSRDHNYKNTITNALFLLTSSLVYLKTENEMYLQNAIKEHEWLSKSGLQRSDGLFNDGLDLVTCSNNNETTWTYNQAVIASGLGALYVAVGTSNNTLLERAQTSLDATIDLLTSKGVLKEPCDDAAPSGSICDKDQQLFKGIWTKHVRYFLDLVNDTSIAAKYNPFLASQSAAICHNALNATNDVGSVWYAPDEGGSLWGPQASASGLEAVISASKYATESSCPRTSHTLVT